MWVGIGRHESPGSIHTEQPWACKDIPLGVSSMHVRIFYWMSLDAWFCQLGFWPELRCGAGAFVYALRAWRLLQSGPAVFLSVVGLLVLPRPCCRSIVWPTPDTLCHWVVVRRLWRKQRAQGVRAIACRLEYMNGVPAG